jgi:hypothetical protein
MNIRPIDSVARVVEHASHDEREERQRRKPLRKKEKIQSGQVYKSDGQIVEEPPPNIDVLV